MDISWKRKAAQTEAVRSPAVAGSFYPDSPQVLSAQVGKFIDDAELTETDGELIGLITPPMPATSILAMSRDTPTNS